MLSPSLCKVPGSAFARIRLFLLKQPSFFSKEPPRNFGGRLLPWQRGGGIDWLQWWKEEQGNPGIAGKDLQIIYDSCRDINLILMRMRLFRSVCNLLDRLCIIFAGS